MKRSVGAFVALLALGSMVVRAQAPAKPGPEHQRLQVFVGNWTMSGELKAGPFGPGGKMTGTDRVESLGGFFVQRTYQAKMSGTGEFRGVEIIGYDPVKKTYFNSAFVNDGSFSTGTATVNGNAWTFTASGVASGKPYQERCTVTLEANNTALTFMCEASADGKTWAPTSEGKATKTK